MRCYSTLVLLVAVVLPTSSFAMASDVVIEGSQTWTAWLGDWFTAGPTMTKESVVDSVSLVSSTSGSGAGVYTSFWNGDAITWATHMATNAVITAAASAFVNYRLGTIKAEAEKHREQHHNNMELLHFAQQDTRELYRRLREMEQQLSSWPFRHFDRESKLRAIERLEAELEESKARQNDFFKRAGAHNM